MVISGPHLMQPLVEMLLRLALKFPRPFEIVSPNYEPQVFLIKERDRIEFVFVYESHQILNEVRSAKKEATFGDQVYWKP